MAALLNQLITEIEAKMTAAVQVTDTDEALRLKSMQARHEKTLRRAGSYNNISIFTKTMIKPGRSLPVEEATKFYRETVKSHVSRYEEKSQMKLTSLPHLPLPLGLVNQSFFYLKA